MIAHVKRAMQAAPAETRPASNGGGLDILPWPKIDFEKFGPIERRPKSRIQKISAANLHRNWVMMPHVTNFDEADITDLEAFRQKINGELGKDAAKVTMLAFLIKAAVHTLQAHPTFNCSLDGEDVVEKRYWHIGFAADTPNGLVVPVIRNADQKSVLQIAAESAELARLAREGKLKPEQMQGGTFTISSLGGIGGTGFTPIINAPEVAILGVTRAAMKPVWDGQQFVPRLTLPLCLSWGPPGRRRCGSGALPRPSGQAAGRHAPDDRLRHGTPAAGTGSIPQIQLPQAKSGCRSFDRAPAQATVNPVAFVVSCHRHRQVTRD